ncbi:amino acid or gaba permease [Coniochaeta sp. 2T2.1]|nr:amino acid or gaba permease [Coniochaeta sp. 2T2.1]
MSTPRSKLPLSYNLYFHLGGCPQREEKVAAEDAIGVAPNIEAGTVLKLNKNEQYLANLGYKQEFFGHPGLFENCAATFTSTHFINGLPVLFGWVMYTGGPKSAFANWTMAVSPSLCHYWMTAWWNWAGWVCVVPGVQQGATNLLLATLEVRFPESEELCKGWFGWLLTAVGMGFPTLPNVRGAASGMHHFQSREGGFGRFYNGINFGEEVQAGDEYCWIIGVLFGAWVFFGYGASAHLAEETHEASKVVAKGMWMATLSSWLLSIPTYGVQLVGEDGAVAVLALLWVGSACATASCFMSAQRVTFAISRDGVLPFSPYYRQLGGNKIRVHAAYLVCGLSIVITFAVIGSSVAFSAITAAAAIATNLGYSIPIAARYTIGRKKFVPAKWNLGRYSPVLGTVAILYIMLLFSVSVLLLPQQTLNYAPVCIGIVTVISLVGWVLPFGLGGRHWFTGPKRTIEELDAGEATS